jgi:dTMP kinase
MKRGCFVTLEGVDGCGKSTQARLLGRQLREAGFTVVETREPGGTVIAEKIRAILIDPVHREMADECELLLYLAARAQHVRETIVPAMNSGAVVLCDRFQEATFAYQGFGRSLSLPLLRSLNSFATGNITPDLTLVYDISVETAMQRLAAMDKPVDRLEAGGQEFFARVREGYRTLAAEAPQRILLLDGTLLPEPLCAMAFQKIKELAETV